MNLNALAGMGGQEISISDLRELNKALRANTELMMKAETVGYPQQGVAYVGGSGGTGEIAPLVPQSIQQTLDTATYTSSAIQFWKMLSKINVTNTLHEATRVNEHGSMGLDPFFAEGGVPGISEAEYERQQVKIKFLAEYMELTDVSTMVGILGPNRTALAQRTQDGTLALLGKLERALFNADSSLSPNHFDGLRAQQLTKAPQNSDDMRGKPVTFQFLQEKLGELMSDPNFAKANTILVDPRQYQALSNFATAYGRHDQVQQHAGSGAVSFGHKALFVGGPQGDVPIIPCSLLRPPQRVNAAALGGNPPNSGVCPTATVTNAGATSGSLFATADAGVYYYRIVGVGDQGVTAPADSGAITVGAGEAVSISIADGAASGAGTHSGIRYYRVFRSAADGTLANSDFLGEFPANDLGGSSATLLIDKNADLPGTSSVYILQNTPDVMCWAQLLDFTRRPLAQISTTIPFLLMLFGALFVKVPTKNWVLTNAALTA